MRVSSISRAIGAGVISGLLAAMAMTAVMLVLRIFAGIPLVAELAGDRFIPYINVFDFLDLLGRFGGPSSAKSFALISSLEGQVIAGIVIGVFYAIVVERGRSSAPRRFDITRRGVLFVAVVVAGIWLVSMALFSGVLWPWDALSVSFLGLPPAWASTTAALGLLLSYTLYGVVLIASYGAIFGRRSVRNPVSPGVPVGRRAFLIGIAGVILALASDWLTGRLTRGSALEYDGLEYLGSDIQPITPNDQFYVVTKGIIDPDIKRSLWRLEVGGQVEDPRTYDFQELSSLSSVEQEMTLECISNPVGGGLISNAVWEGVRLRDIIEAADPRPEVVEVLLQAADGYAHTIPLEYATNPNALIAYAMNGEPLPDRHGYPARALIPGYYGEASVKWITRIELLDHAEKRYYTLQGWEPQGLSITTRLYSPNFRNTTARVGQTTSLQGLAFAGNRGISKVEVSTNGGESWQQAQITYSPSRIVWAFWRYEWRPQSTGEHRLTFRATDADGELQTSRGSGIAPDGSSGRQNMTVEVED